MKVEGCRVPLRPTTSRPSGPPTHDPKMDDDSSKSLRDRLDALLRRAREISAEIEKRVEEVTAEPSTSGSEKGPQKADDRVPSRSGTSADAGETRRGAGSDGGRGGSRRRQRRSGRRDGGGALHHCRRNRYRPRRPTGPRRRPDDGRPRGRGRRGSGRRRGRGRGCRAQESAGGRAGHVHSARRPIRRRPPARSPTTRPEPPRAATQRDAVAAARAGIDSRRSFR